MTIFAEKGCAGGLKFWSITHQHEEMCMKVGNKGSVKNNTVCGSVVNTSVTQQCGSLAAQVW